MSTGDRGSIARRGWLAFGVVLTAVQAVMPAVPASAVPPFASRDFNPQDTALFTCSEAGGDFMTCGTTAPDRLVLSDRFDGVDTAAHITSVATTDADRAIYVLCPPDFVSSDDPMAETHTPDPADVAALEAGPVPPAGCIQIGQDQSGELLPTVPGTFVPGAIDEAYELHWDIPESLDFTTYDFLAYHCQGAPTSSEPGGNCRREIESNVVVDDAQTGRGSSAGELWSWCVNMNPLLEIAAPDCDDPGDTQLHPLTHPSSIPHLSGPYAGGQLIVETRVSSNVARATLCLDVDADAQDPPDDCAPSDTASTQASPAFGTTRHDFDVVSENAEQAFFVYENDLPTDDSVDEAACSSAVTPPSGTPPPAGTSVDCLLDTHYVVSREPVPAQVHAHNDEDPEHPDDPDAFEDDEPSLVEHADRIRGGVVGTGRADQVIGQVYDQFADLDLDPATGDADPDGTKDTASALTMGATWELGAAGASFETPQGAVDPASCESGITHDHDGNGMFEHCHFGPDDYGDDDKAAASFVPVDSGPVTATFCVDDEQQDPTAFGHGCWDAQAFARDSVTKDAAADFDHAHVRYAEDVTPMGPASVCHTGISSKTKTTQYPVALTGCVLDQFHNPAEGIPVIWRITDGPGQFGPVEQVTDANGQADGEVTAIDASEGEVTTVEFCTDFNLNGVCDSEDSGTIVLCPRCRAQVQVTWTSGATGQGPPPPGPTATNALCDRSRPGAGGNELLIGTAGKDHICGFGGRDTLRGRKGPDVLRGGRGKDILAGGPGRDTLRGGRGKDSLRGGKGADTLRGGRGRDTARGGPGKDLCRKARTQAGCER